MTDQTTSIYWSEDQKVAHIVTSSDVCIKKLDKYCRLYPDVYRHVEQDDMIGEARYEVYKGLIRFAKPRYEEEER